MTNTGNINQEFTTRTVKIDSDLSAKSKHFVVADTTDDDVVNIATDGSAPSMVLVEGALGSASSVQTGTIVVDGVYYVTLAGTVESMDLLMPTTGGAAIKATDGNFFGAQALRQGVSGDVIPCKAVAGYFENT